MTLRVARKKRRGPKLLGTRLLKAKIAAGQRTSLSKAEANAMKLIGRPRI